MVDSIHKIVISDTTAITYLAKINGLGLLRDLFKIIYIPEAVFHELTRQGDHIPGSIEVKTLNWIRVKKVANMNRINKLFKEKLHLGESESIGLALQMNAHLLIMDERDGRREAINQGLRVTGMLGIFLKAKELKRIPCVKPYLDKLRLTNFKMSPQLYEQVLIQAGEQVETKKA
jgi:uncharacterized protein